MAIILRLTPLYSDIDKIVGDPVYVPEHVSIPKERTRARQSAAAAMMETGEVPVSDKT